MTLIYCQPERAVELQQVLASYMGHFKHADSYRLMRGIFKSFPFLSELFELAPDNKQILSRIKPKTLPTSLVAQYNWFVRQHPQTIVLAQVGRFCELYDHCARQATQVLKLNLACKVRGFATQAGFPMRGLCRAKQRLRQARMAYIVIAEHGYLSNGLKQRVMTEKSFCLQNQNSKMLSLRAQAWQSIGSGRGTTYSQI